MKPAACVRAEAGTADGAWTAIVLAGDRPGGDLLAERFGAEAKALIEVGGEAMVSRVVRTLLDCPSVGSVLLVAQDPERVATDWIRRSPRVSLAASRGGIASSVAAIAGSDAAPWPVLVTTADHPLLTPQIVEYFIAESDPADVSLGLVERRTMLAAFPETRRTWISFKDGAYTGANLFALKGPGAGAAIARMEAAETDRKNPVRLLWHLGPSLLLGAAMRSLTLADAVAHAARRFAVRVAAVRLPMAEAGIDVDKPEDHRAVEAILAKRSGIAGPPGRSRLRLSVFDVDRTLTRRGTYSAFLAYAAARLAPWRLLLAPAALGLFLAHRAGFVTRKGLKEGMQLLLLGRRVRRERIGPAAAAFADRLIASGLHRDAIDRIEHERREGGRIVFASAANSFYLDPLGERLGAADLVCTQSSWDGDELLPAIAGANCYGGDKLDMLRNYLDRSGLRRPDVHVRFFTDHHSDACTLDWADEAFVVNPGRKLRGLALRRGWRILDWT